MILMIIGVTGTIGSGKGEFCKIFEAKGYTKLAFGDEVRRELHGRRIAENREKLQRLGFELKDDLAERIGKQIEKGKK